METRRITVISAGLGVPSSSRLLADQLAASAERQLAAAGYAVDIEVWSCGTSPWTSPTTLSPGTRLRGSPK